LTRCGSPMSIGYPQCTHEGMLMEDIIKRFIRDLELRIEAMKRAIHEDIEEVLRRVSAEFHEEPMWGHEGYLEPLISVKQDRGGYLIAINIPLADVNKLSIDAKGRKIIFKCSLRKDLSFNRWSGSHRNIVFKEYYKEIMLPEDADISRLSIRRRRDMVLIRVPRK